VAVGCVAHAAWTQGSGDEEAAAAPQSAEEVGSLLASGKAEVSHDGWETQLPNMAVRLKTLKGFVEGTPAPVLDHALCAYRFHCKMLSSYGKKVQTFAAPEGQWMRWASPSSLAAARAGPEGSDAQEQAREVDRERAAVIYDGYQKMLRQEQQPEGASPQGGDVAADANRAAGGLSLRTLEESTRAMVAFRRRLERRLIVRAAEEMSTKELRAAAIEHMHAFLEEVGLDKVIGLERWARETADDIARTAADEFMVEVVADRR